MKEVGDCERTDEVGGNGRTVYWQRMGGPAIGRTVNGRANNWQSGAPTGREKQRSAGVSTERAAGREERGAASGDGGAGGGEGGAREN